MEQQFGLKNYCFELFGWLWNMFAQVHYWKISKNNYLNNVFFFKFVQISLIYWLSDIFVSQSWVYQIISLTFCLVLLDLWVICPFSQKGKTFSNKFSQFILEPKSFHFCLCALLNLRRYFPTVLVYDNNCWQFVLVVRNPYHFPFFPCLTFYHKNCTILGLLLQVLMSSESRLLEGKTFNEMRNFNYSFGFSTRMNWKMMAYVQQQ